MNKYGSCRFAYINHLLFCRSRCRPRPCLSEIGDESEKSRFQFCSQALAVSQSILIQDFVSATNFDENILLLAFSKFSLLDEIFDMVVKRCPNCDQTVSNK